MALIALPKLGASVASPRPQMDFPGEASECSLPLIFVGKAARFRLIAARLGEGARDARELPFGDRLGLARCHAGNCPTRAQPVARTVPCPSGYLGLSPSNPQAGDGCP